MKSKFNFIFGARKILVQSATKRFGFANGITVPLPAFLLHFVFQFGTHEKRKKKKWTSYVLKSRALLQSFNQPEIRVTQGPGMGPGRSPRGGPGGAAWEALLGIIFYYLPLLLLFFDFWRDLFHYLALFCFVFDCERAP